MSNRPVSKFSPEDIANMHDELMDLLRGRVQDGSIEKQELTIYEKLLSRAAKNLTLREDDIYEDLAAEPDSAIEGLPVFNDED